MGGGVLEAVRGALEDKRSQEIVKMAQELANSKIPQERGGELRPPGRILHNFGGILEALGCALEVFEGELEAVGGAFEAKTSQDNAKMAQGLAKLGNHQAD